MKQFTYTSFSSLLSVIREFLPSMEQFIDESKLIGTVIGCNDKLGVSIREVKEDIIRVRDYQAVLPFDFQKVIYVAALQHSSFGLSQFTDPFDNFVNLDEDVCTVEFVEGCETRERRVINKKKGDRIVHAYRQWTELSLSNSSYIRSASNCINKTLRGQYTIDITDEKIETPFREGELYIMYYANLLDEDGSIKVPFNSQIFPWYKWSVAEEICIQMMMNSDADVSGKLKFAQGERIKAWLDAFNFTIDQSYAEAVQYQKKREMELYNRYFRWIQ